jgi:Starch-binding associating with outer membrane
LDEVSRDPQGVNTPTINSQFTKILAGFRPDYSEIGLLWNDIVLLKSEMLSTTGTYGVDPIIRTGPGIWSTYYNVLAHKRNLDLLIAAETGDPELYKNVKAASDIAMAYRTIKVTDHFGDMPYSEAGYAYFPESQQITRPKFDTQESIYKAVLENLTDAVNLIETDPTKKTTLGNPYHSLGAADPILKNDLVRWKKFGNSLRLIVAMRIFDKDAALAGPVIVDALSKPLLEEGEDIILKGSVLNDGADRRGPFNAASSSGVRMGTTIWNSISSTNAADGSGIFDPRAKIYFEPNKLGQWVAVPQTGTPPGDLGSDAYNPSRATTDFASKASNFCPINFFLIYDRDVPDVVISSAEVKFLKAEAYMRGAGVTKDVVLAENNYEMGITESIKYWNKVKNDVVLWPGRPANITPDDITAFLANPAVALSGTDADKLKQIYKQYWLALFWEPNSAFNLMRRTNGTPTTGTYDNTYFRMTYPIAESLYNTVNYDTQKTAMGGDLPTVKTWWMK